MARSPVAPSPGFAHSRPTAAGPPDRSRFGYNWPRRRGVVGMSMAESRDQVADSARRVAGSETKPVQVFTLGSFRVIVEGRILQDDAWRRRNARQVFNCLLSSL